MLTQEDLQNIRVELGEVLVQVVMPQFERIDERFERIDERFDRIESELRAIKEEIAAFRRDLEALSKRDKEDSGAFAHEILNMKRRIDALEERVDQKEAAMVAG